MSSRAKQFLWLLLRVVVTAGCFTWVILNVDLVDRVELADGTSAYGWITERTPTAVTLRVDTDSTRTIAVEDVAVDPETGQPIVVDGFVHVLSDVFTGGKWYWFAAAVFAYALSPLFGALRWRMLLRIQNIHLTFFEAWRLTWIGFFFNTFMLGITGGDIVKAYYVTRKTHHKAEAVTVVFLDRLVGVLGMATLCLIALASQWWAPALGGERWIIVAFLGGALAMGLVFYSHRVRRIVGIEALIDRLPFQKTVRRLDQAAFVYRHHRLTVFVALVLSWCAHLVSIASVYFGALALDLGDRPPDAGYFLVFMPLIYILSALVPSVGGLGVMEGLAQQYFSPAVLGVATKFAALSAAPAVILIWRAAMFAAVLPGGVFNAMGRDISLKDARHEIEEDSEKPPSDGEPGGDKTPKEQPDATG